MCQFRSSAGLCSRRLLSLVRLASAGGATLALLTGGPGRAAAGEGGRVEERAPPEATPEWARACSFRHPLCIHGSPRTPAASTLAALAASDEAWDALTGALDLPEPDGDADGAWHAYLVDEAALESVGDTGSTAVLAARDPVARFDRASSFGLIDGAIPFGCRLDLAAARALSRAALLRLAPATDDGSARAEAQAVAQLVTPCAAGIDDERVFQSEPERTVVDPVASSFDRGASLFFDWLDGNFATRPAALIGGLWALTPTQTPRGAWKWGPGSTGFDVLRVSLKDALSTGSTLDDVLVRFAVHRAVLTPTPRPAWQIPWPFKARRFASPVPVSPTGSSYVVVEMAGAPPLAKLRVEAAWEDFGRMRWEVLKLDGQGRLLADVPVTSLPLGTSASMTIENLDGVGRVVVVGVNVGSTEHPFDPGQGSWQPHGWLLTVEGE
jgi:hypothetical protein